MAIVYDYSLCYWILCRRRLLPVTVAMPSSGVPLFVLCGKRSCRCTPSLPSIGSTGCSTNLIVFPICIHRLDIILPRTTGATHRLISVDSWSNYGAIYHMRIDQIHASGHYIVCKVLSNNWCHTSVDLGWVMEQLWCHISYAYPPNTRVQSLHCL